MTAAVTFADNLTSYIWIVMGVIIGVVLPLLSKYVKEHFKASAIDLKPYVLLLLFGGVLGIVILAAMRNQSDDAIKWYAALLAGYGGEATLEKLLKP